MMDPDQIPQGADSVPSPTCVDAQRLRCSATLGNIVSKFLDDDNNCSRPGPLPPLDDENLLQEILLRLPPHPSSLLRASLVCTRWRSILSNTDFVKSYRKHHQKPPLLGFFSGKPLGENYVFTSILQPPDRIPPTRFAMPRIPCETWIFTGCRHGLALLFNISLRQIIVWDPLTGQQHCVTFPPAIDINKWSCSCNATVLCADAAEGHVHGDCFSSPFKLVLIWVVGYTQTYSCLYESTYGVWGDVASTASTDMMCYTVPSVLAGNALCWLFHGCDIIVFNLERQSLGVIEKPANSHSINYYGSACLLRIGDSTLGLAISSEQLTIQLWERKPNCYGVVGWVLLQKITPLESLFPQGMPIDDTRLLLVGYDEDTNVIVLSTRIGKFVLQLESMEIKRLSGINDELYMAFYPYTNFYTAGSFRLATENLVAIKEEQRAVFPIISSSSNYVQYDL